MESNSSSAQPASRVVAAPRVHASAIRQVDLASRDEQRELTSVDVVRFDQLTGDDRSAWQRLRASRPEFGTPFFSLAFADAVHASRNDVLVAVIRRSQEIVGLFPFHRIGAVAFPVGRFFNDAHNVIADSATNIDWIWLLKQCSVKAFNFHAMVGSSEDFQARHGQGTIQSFSANLGDDSIDFLRRLGEQHNTIRRQPQKSRKMAREIGDVTLEVDCRDPDLLEQTIRWKRQQYQRTNILDLFTPQWTRDLVAVLHQKPTSTDARGLLSVLRAGDRVVAAHYGIREGDLLHYWFPCYDITYRQYSPGTALFTELVRQASDHGIRCIDMGYGEQPYKRKQTDTITSVTYGCVSRSRLYRHWHRFSGLARKAIKKLPMKEPLKRVLRSIRPTAGISQID